jgi:hypothetical protein
VSEVELPSRKNSAAAGTLTALGLAWNLPKYKGSNETAWDAQLAKLTAYKAAHGDCSVPQRWAEDLRLGRWVKDQRSFKKKLDRGEPSEGMTAARAAKLTALGFSWGQQDDELARMQAVRGHLLRDRQLRDQAIAAPSAAAAAVGISGDQRRAVGISGGTAPSTARGMTAERTAQLMALALGLTWAPDPNVGCAAPRNEVGCDHHWEAQLAKISKQNSAAATKEPAAWEAQLAKLAAYKAAHGDCSVPYSWAEDPPLGRWVGNQRALKRKLDRGKPSDGMTVVRAAKLKALGFAWELSAVATSNKQSNNARDDTAWEAQLARLAAYKVAHGDCSVPAGWAEEPRLGRWVKEQRWLKRKLDRGEPCKGMTLARAAKLTALELVWDPNAKAHPNEGGWEAQLAKLAAYKAVHGDCSVPRCWAEDLRLGKWVSAQRYRKRKLDHGENSEGMTAARAARLTALGLAWDLGYSESSSNRSKAASNEAGWEENFARLAAYKAAHGECSVPNRWAEDLTLGRWVKQQRHLKRKLDRGEPGKGMTAARAARLTALGFAWEVSSERKSAAMTYDVAWEAQLAKLAAYKAAHGDCSVPGYKLANSPTRQLAGWVHTQRSGKKKLDRGEPGEGMTAARVAKLTALGLVWNGAGGAVSLSLSLFALCRAMSC